jgi:hypothetical protein
MDVVCIDAKPKKGWVQPIVPIQELLEEGRVYRISAIRWSMRACDLRTGDWFVHPAAGRSVALEGIELPEPMKGFAAYRFRKLTPKEDAGVELARTIEAGELVS